MLIQRLKPHHCFSAWCAGWLFLSACAIPTLGQELPLPKDTLPETLELIRVPLGLEQVHSDVVSEEWVALGRRLFFDPILSADQTVSCATCHQPDHGFASPEAVSVGIGGMKGTRNAPSILNTVYRKSLFWDGRTATLEEQALEPIENAVEMGHDLSNIIGRLQEDPGYSEQFVRVFGQPVSEEGLSKALASFQRVLLSGDHGVDRFRAGEFKALTTEERNGMWIFESKGQCWRCHSGANLTDEDFHNTGVSWGKEPLDLGRFDVTGNLSLIHI